MLAKLAGDEDPEVRLTVASNWWTPKDKLRVLTQDEDPEVRSAASQAMERRQGLFDWGTESFDED